MLFDTQQGLRALHDAIGAFLDSSSLTTSFDAATGGAPAPYDEFLRGLRISKGGATRLQVSTDRWLELSGSPQDIHALNEHLFVSTDREHHHWYTAPISLIIEAQESWPGKSG
jgi:hypothetical protein